MIYENYHAMQMYSNQHAIGLPKEPPPNAPDPLPDEPDQSTKDDTKVDGTKGQKKEPVERIGHHNAVVMLSPSMMDSINLLDTGIFMLKPSMYRWFYTDQYFSEKIGRKTIVKNSISQIRRVYDDERHPLKLVPNGSKKEITKQGKNMILDLGSWLELYFRYAYRNGTKNICNNFIRFLFSKVNNSLLDKYRKFILIDLAMWPDSKKLMNTKFLNNPLSILVYTMYKYPTILPDLSKFEFIIIDSRSKQLLKIPGDQFTKKTYPKLKQKLSLFKDVEINEEEELSAEEPPVEEDPITSPPVLSETKKPLAIVIPKSLQKQAAANRKINDIKLGPYTPPSPSRPKSGPAVKSDKIIHAELNVTAKEELKKKLSTTIKHNLLGSAAAVSTPKPAEDEVEDITKAISDDFDELEKELDEPLTEDKLDADLVSDLSAEIDAQINELIDKNEDILKDKTEDEIAAMAEKAVASKVYHMSFMPKHTPEQEKRIQELAKVQETIIRPPSINDIKSKVIDETPIAAAIKTKNPNIQSSKFINFDKGYVEKKMESDIDSAVASISKAAVKVFVQDKSVVDSSDTMNLKSTYTYHLVDENGKKMTLKFDIPKIIDGNYIYVNGSKKVIGHQFIMKPLVKTSPNEVQIVTWYNKIFVHRAGSVDALTGNIQAYLLKNMADFNVQQGNGFIKNKGYNTSLDYDMYAKIFYQFTVGDNHFVFDIQALLTMAHAAGCNTKSVDLNKVVPVGYNRKTKQLITINHNDPFTDRLFELFAPDDQKAILKIKRKPSLITSEATIMMKKKASGKAVPTILFLFFCEGFSSIMQKAKIEYHFLNKGEEKTWDGRIWGFIELEDCILAWKRKPLTNSMFMNSLYSLGFSNISKDQLEDRDTYSYMISRFYSNPNIVYSLDNFKDFMIDDASKEMLTDMGYPTNIVDLLILATRMLEDNAYLPENDMNNTRIRSNEVIANILYNQIAAAYHGYVRTAHRKTPSPVNIPQNAVIEELLSDRTRMVEESSQLNPVLELEKSRAVTFKGLRGIQMDRAMTLPRRAYDETMLGVIGISSSPKIVGW